MELENQQSVNFVPCVQWVRRGVAQACPVKVELSKQELEEVIRQTRASLHVNDDEDSGTENDVAEEPVGPADPEDEFNMDAYDDEDGALGPKLADVAQIDTSDGLALADTDEKDSEDEDDLIKPTDNLIVVGHVEGDASMLEVYVHNEDEGSLYVHHDILLPSIPLCLEWLNYDPENIHVSSNLCAVGSMDCIIQVWDLDIVNSIEPAYKLGRKRSKKKSTPSIGHKDAVLDLSWNTNLTHILASGSVDQRVLLWDLEVKLPNTELTAFSEKVQTIMWHPRDSHSLLTGSSDKTVKVWDCRSQDHKSWTLAGEAERVYWDSMQETRFFAGDNQGYLYMMDTRQDGAVWSHKAYDKTITGLHASPMCPGLVVTISEQGLAKIWDFEGSEPSVVAEKMINVGEAQCLDVAPETGFLVAVGGDNRSHYFTVQSIDDIEAVKNRFARRAQAAVPIAIEGVPGPSTSRATTVKVREKRPRSGERALNAKKKPKTFNQH